ncbi:MAG: ABC transporter permease [Planctomycetota bacterium]
MIDAFSPFVAWRYLLTRRINLLAVFGVTFAVWAILLVDSVFTGFVSQIRQDVRSSACDLMVTDLPHDASFERLAAVIAGVEGVVATAPRLRHHGLLLQVRQRRTGIADQGSSQVDFDHTQNGFALLVGVDPDREAAVSGLRRWLERGPDELAQRYPGDFWRSPVLDDADAGRRARLGMPDADEWRARRRAGLPHEARSEDQRGAWPGVLFGWQRVRQLGWFPRSEPFDVVCASFTGGDGGAALHTHSLRVGFAGCFATGSRAVDEGMVLLPIETLRTMLGQDAADPASVDVVTDVAVRLRDGLPPAAVAATAAAIRERVQAALPPGAAPCLVADWQQQNETFLSAVAHEQGMMQFVLFVVMLVAAFVIYATLHMMVVQKVKDIGILAALGGSPRSVGGVFLVSGLAVALVGTTLGLLAGVLSAWNLNAANEWMFANFQLELFPRRLFDLREVPCRLEPSWIATVAAGAVALAVIVAAVPSRQAARMHPVLCLSRE